MAARVLQACWHGRDYVVQIHLDVTRVLWETVEAVSADGTPVMVRTGQSVPDPRWVMESRWSPEESPESVEQCLREALALARDRYRELTVEPGEQHPITEQLLELDAGSNPLPESLAPPTE